MYHWNFATPEIGRPFRSDLWHGTSIFPHLNLHLHIYEIQMRKRGKGTDGEGRERRRLVCVARSVTSLSVPLFAIFSLVFIGCFGQIIIRRSRRKGNRRCVSKWALYSIGSPVESAQKLSTAAGRIIAPFPFTLGSIGTMNIFFKLTFSKLIWSERQESGKYM